MTVGVAAHTSRGEPSSKTARAMAGIQVSFKDYNRTVFQNTLLCILVKRGLLK